MCGIAGFSAPQINPAEQKRIITSMLERIRHRGTDHSGHMVHGTTVLGHNRLSVLDVSEGAHQPFDFGKFRIVFNGEVYNYVEIREELISLGHEFHTTGDTEVVLHAFAEWGNSCVERFMGMWAFAILNLENGDLFCSRDRFGIKPFYFIEGNDAFFFASEANALKESPLFSGLLNHNHIARFLYLGFVEYKDESFFAGVKMLEAGCNLIYTNGILNISRYWSPQSKTLSNLTFDQAKAEFLRLMKQSVAQHLRSDVKLGACLSGGIDSSSMLALMSQTNPLPVEAFHVYYDGPGDTDERPFVQEMLKAYPNIEPHFFTPSEEDIIEAFSKMTHVQDGPVPGSAVFSQYFLFKMAASRGIKVMLDGQGADEYLAGYHNFYPWFFAWLLKHRPGKYFSEIGAYARAMDFGMKQRLLLCLKSLKNLVLPYAWSKERAYRKMLDLNLLNFQVDSGLKLYETNKITFEDDVFAQHLMTMVLPHLLHFEDRNSMAFTIESRVPYLDHRLVEFAFALPFDFKIKNGLTKYILRESMKGITPNAILERRDKKGFTTPGEVKWLRGSLKFTLEPENLKHLSSICNMKQVISMIEDFKAGNNQNAEMIWRLVSLNEWLKRSKLN